MRSLRESVLALLEQGLAPIPISSASEDVDLSTSVTATNVGELFPNGAALNVGVLLGAPSGGLVAIGLPSLEAACLASLIGLGTRQVGRGGRALSALYRCMSPPESERLCDPAGDALVDLRTTGYVLAPGSVNDSEDPIEWIDPTVSIASTTASVLLDLTRLLAAGVIIARCWPADAGEREKVGLALAGGLIQLGFSAETTSGYVGLIARTAGDPEAATYALSAVQRARRFADSDSAYGWPTLMKIIDPAVIGSVRGWLGSVTPDDVDAVGDPKARPSSEAFPQSGDDTERVSTKAPTSGKRPGKRTTPARPKAPGAGCEARSVELIVREISSPDSSGTRIQKATPEEALRAALDLDVSGYREPIIRWSGRDCVLMLDYDREGDVPVDPEEVPNFFPNTLPQPLAAWATHDRGLRAAFIEVDGVPAIQSAAAWAFLAPLRQLVGWRLEVKTDTRHPAGLRDGARCGRVHWFTPSARLVVPGNDTRSAAGEAEIGRWLEERGLSYGRHPTERCIWCGNKPASGSPAVTIDERGFGCFRCKRTVTWDALVGGFVKADRPSLHVAAQNLVHFPHQRHVLRDLRPSLPEELLLPAWTLMLSETHTEKLTSSNDKIREAWEALVDRAASTRIDVVRSVSGAWLDQQTLIPRKVSSRLTLAEMPWCRSPTMIDAAANSGPLRGFTPIQPVGAQEVLGPFVEPPPGSIFVAKPIRPGAPPAVDLGEKRPPADLVVRARAALERRLPGLHIGYLRGLITVRFVAQRCLATPPLVACTGATGTAKTATTKLAAAATGTMAGIVRLGDAKETLRGIGLTVESGCGLVYLDEIGRVPRTYERLEPVLALNSSVTFEAKYRNECTVPMTASVSLLGSTLPMSIVRSPEISRRAVGWRLLDPAVRWQSIGTDIAFARDLDDLREFLDVITADTWWRLRELGPRPDWRKLCLDEYGAVLLAGLDQLDLDGEGTAEAVRRLYEHFRTATESELYGGARWPGWLMCGPGTRAGRILEELVDFEGDATQQHAETAELGRLDLGLILGFCEPRLRLTVQRRGARWLVKFTQEGVLRGRERPRTSLPPVTRAATTSIEVGENPSAVPVSGSGTPDADDYEEFEL